jgi:hypothetical protein
MHMTHSQEQEAKKVPVGMAAKPALPLFMAPTSSSKVKRLYDTISSGTLFLFWHPPTANYQ